MSDERIKIRCPQCHRDGKARAEHINRRVSCKYCSHVFRVTPVEESAEVPAAPPMVAPARPKPGSAASGRHAARQRIDGLEDELKRLRDELSAQSAETPAFGWAEAQAAELREQLAEAQEEARKAGALLREAEAARSRIEKVLHAEAEELRAEVARAREEHSERERALLGEIAGLREHLDETVVASPGADRVRSLEDELRIAREDLAQARDAAEAADRDHRSGLAELEAQHSRALDEGRGQLDRSRAEIEAGHRQALDAQRLDRERADAEAGRSLEEAREQLAGARADLEEFAATREDRDRLAAELEALRGRLDEASGELERSRADRESEVQGLREELAIIRAGVEDSDATREQLAHARARLEEADAARRDLEEARERADRLAADLEAAQAQLAEARARAEAVEAEAEPNRRERDEARVQRDRASEELESLRTRFEEVQRAQEDWDFASTEMEVPKFQASVDEVAGEVAAQAHAKLAAEAEALRLELAEAREAAEAASRARDELAARVRRLEEVPVTAALAPATAALAPTEDAPAIDAARRLAVDEAVKGAWADFERRLSETQAKLKAANARADLLEAEAREAREQAGSRRQGLGLEDDDSSSEFQASMTSIRILSDRGTAQLTPADAESRLALARQLAVERKDKSLIDRIAKMAEKVRDDLEARNFTLAETLVRGAEIEVGLDPGGYSIHGLRIFRPSPSIVGSLAALEPAFDRVLKQGDLGTIRSTIGEIRTILGDQAGLPDIRRPGRTPAVKRPIEPAEAIRLFLGAVEAEQWLTRPIAAKRPLPDTSLATYAALVEACSEAYLLVEKHAPEKLGLVDQILQACAAMLLRRQQPDGHFPFLDPRGRPSKLATVVEAMVARSPAAVKDGWVVAADPSGVAQVETGHCGIALLSAGAVLNRPEWTQAALKAADWAADQPCLTSFPANARLAGLLARAYLVVRQDRHLAALASKLGLGLLPAQVENGRWLDALAAQTPNHLVILQALQDAWEALPADRAPLRAELKAGLDRAVDSLLEECKALGVPSQGWALRALVRQRDLTRPDLDPRLEPAIVDSATVVQELCHDGAKPKLGVAPDQLAALARV